MRGVVLALALLGLAVSGAEGAANTVYTARPTSACLSAHKLLVTAIPKATAVPKPVPVVAALQFSFAMVPGQALDNGEIVFERDAPTAKRAWSALFEMNVAEAAQVQGISLAKAVTVIRQSMGLHANAITLWRNHPVHAASRSRVLGCLR